MKTNFNIVKNVRNSRSINALGALRKLQSLGLLLCALMIGSLQVWGATYTYDFTTANNFYTTQGGSTHPATGSGNKFSNGDSFYASDGAQFTVLYDDKVYFNTGYIMVGNQSPVFQLPTYAGEKITQVKFWNSSGCSTKVRVTIKSGSSTASAEQTWSTQSSTYTYSIGASYQASTLKLNVVSANAQITKIQITTTSDCANSVTINKGTGTNCTFTLSKSGAQASCDGVSTTVSITPSTGYGAPVVTQSGASKTPTISGSGNSQTVTYAANTTGTSTINVSCSALTTTVSFNQNGGEGGQTATKTATYGQAMPTPITLPTRYGHTFGGYYDGAGGTGTQYYTNTGASARNWDKTSATATLYAKWTENELTNYRTTCESCATASSVTASPVTGNTATINWSGAVSSTGYTIVWSTGSSFPGSLDASNSHDVASGTSSYQITGLTEGTTYNVWVISKCDDSRSESINFTTPVEHTITFNYPDGFTFSGTTPLSVADGATFTFPNVTKPGSGYDCVASFKGWVAGENYIGQTEFINAGTTSDAVTADATYTAVFVQNDGSSGAGANDYEMVTDEADLESGEKYLMVGYKAGTYYALGKQNSNNRPGVEVTVDDGLITGASVSVATAAGQDSKVYELTLGGSEGAWTFKDVSNQYLYASSGSSNYLKLNGSIDSKGKTEWAISIEKDGHATIDTKYYTYDEDGAEDHHGSIFFNTGSTLFACYVKESESPRVYLFKKGGTSKFSLTATPNCNLRMSGDVAVTSYNGRGIMAATPLAVLANGLTANTGTVTLTSNNSDVYFSANRLPNFAKASTPSSSVVLTANGSGVIDADVYVHYKPSSAGNGSASTVIVTATPSGGLTGAVEHLINVRNMSEKFVIAAKFGGTWYALPSDIGDTECTPEAIVIDVDENTMTATASKTAPKTCTFTLWPVRTTNSTSSDRYSSDGGNAGECIRLAAISVDNEALWANNAASSGTTKIKTANAITTIGSTGGEANEWRVYTTITDGKWTYNLQSNQSNQIDKSRYLYLYKDDVVKWGTYNSGVSNNLYFLPVTETEPFDMKVVEWYPTKILIQTSNAVSSPTVTIGGSPVAGVTCTGKGSKLYEITIPGLSNTANAAKTMRVSYTADAKTYSACAKVPIIISRTNVDVVNGSSELNDPFSTLTPAVYNTADLVVRDGATLKLNGTRAQNEFFDVTIYPTSKISVPAEKKLSVHSLTFFGGIDEIYDGSSYSTNKYGVPELSLKGTCGRKTKNIIDYVMRVDLDQMYAVSVPYEVSLSGITYWDGTACAKGSQLYISAYDGAARATKSGKTWIYETAFDPAKLQPGIGYTISAELQPGVGDTYSILRMPMTGTFVKDETEAAKTVYVYAYTAEGITPNNKGWNLVANPYMVSISGSSAGGADDSKLIVGHLVEDGTSWKIADGDTYRYVTIPYDSGDGYEQTKWSLATLKPFKNFFLQVQTEGNLAFALASRNNMPARYLQTQEREVEFEVTLTNGDKSDNLGLLIAEEYSSAYEGNADLEKMEGVMCVYTIFGGYKLAYNALNPTEAAGSIPVGYIANVAGSYTFSYDTGDTGELEHVWLTDNDEHQTVDLLVDDYVFTTAAGRNETRFVLSTELKEESTATDLEDLEDAAQPMKFIYQDKLYILRGGVIYDATGKRVREINK